jgi:hypothetical protein
MFVRIGVVSMALSLTAASAARAQSPANVLLFPVAPVAAPAPEVNRSGVGPSVESGIAAARRPAVAPSLALAQGDAGSPHVGRDVAFMAVGGAGVVVGAIIGGTSGTVFMVAGGLVLLYGLFEYLQ